jgi:predicted NBD/HSP70 family sugar kinase
MNNTNPIYTEQSRKRAENRYAILRTLQSVRSMKRTELADYCGIRKSSVTSLVDELLENKWVRLENDARPRSPLMMNENNWQTVCVELDEGRIIVGRLDLNGEIVERQEYKSSKMSTKQGMLDELLKYVKVHVEKCPSLVGIAVSVPGIVDSETGSCISSINLPNFNNIPLKELLFKEFSCKIVVENDIQSSLYSSIFLDKRTKKLNTAIYLDITSGVGASILVHGTPLQGNNSAAGEIGHLKAGNEGLTCRCGQKDCLETYSSIPAICKKINSKFNLDVKSSDDIIKASEVHAGIKNVLKEASEHIAIPLSAMMAAIDPEVVILGNQNRKFYELMTPSLKKALEERLNGPASRNLKLEITREHSSLRGAAAYLMDLQFAAVN